MEGSVDYDHLIRYLKDGRLVRKLRTYLKDGRLVRKLRTENNQLKREVTRLRKEIRQYNR